jgi:hypothetical protein
LHIPLFNFAHPLQNAILSTLNETMPNYTILQG